MTKLNRFTSLSELSDAQLLDILELAESMKRSDYRSREAEGKVLGLLFFNPSLRTKVSFEAAAVHLGAGVSVISPGQGTWSMEMRKNAVMDGDKTEHIKEAVQVLSQYCDAIGVRAFSSLKDRDADYAEDVLSAVLEYATVPVINLESAMAHPCQAMADWMTLREILGPNGLKGKKLVLTWAPHPFPLPMAVPLSVLDMATRSGIDVTLACPPDRLPDAELMVPLRRQAEASGSALVIDHDQEGALHGADVVYAKAWAGPGVYTNPDQEAVSRLETHRNWTLTPDKMALTNDARFMHCLPVRRNVVVADAVLDGPSAVHIQQASNRLHVQKAILRKIWLAETAIRKQ
jgi:N-acetylornithine carbamoyltransferase